VAITAFREFLVHGRGVWRTVAVGALGHRLVPACVAVDAGNIAVFGLTGRQQVERSVVTGSTLDGWRLRPKVQFQGFVRLVAGIAVGLGHVLRMRLMALNAFGNHPMLFGMAEVAGHLFVFAGIGGQLLPLLLMTGQANLFELPFKTDVQGGVGIVAALAVCDLEVRSTCMTIAA
jgi:hypothetical protein